MARKKPARPANKKAVKKVTKKAAPKAAARKAVKKAKRVVKKPVKTAKKAAKAMVRKAKKASKAVVRKAKKPVKKAKPAARKAPAKKAAPVKKAAPKKAAAPAPVVSKKPNLDRPRKTVADIHGIPSSLGMARLASAAHSGGEDMRDTLKKNNSTSPRLTGGDADWQTADSHGDESPGGDNPTPDQDVVDEIGRALGVEYADDEELQGGAEISERDTHRWELDPNSKDDFEDKD